MHRMTVPEHVRKFIPEGMKPEDIDLFVAGWLAAEEYLRKSSQPIAINPAPIAPLMPAPFPQPYEPWTDKTTIIGDGPPWPERVTWFCEAQSKEK